MTQTEALHDPPKPSVPSLALRTCHCPKARGLTSTYLLQVLPQVQVDGVVVGEGVQVGLWEERWR